MFQIASLDHVALTVKDQNISLEWYQRVLGMERRYEEANGAKDPAFVCAGKACLALFPAETSDLLPVPDYQVVAMRHFAFRLDRANFELAQVELSEQQIPFRFEDHTMAHSMYLSDPDGHRVELTTYELS
jgi:catechol 2,3-dioxygenase-like lactoylglutathione lyase family enzyme